MTEHMPIRLCSIRATFRPFAVRLVALASAGVLIAACGSDDDESPTPPVGAAGTASTETDPLQPTGGAGGAGGAPTGSAGTGNGSGGSETQSSDDLPNVAGAGNAPGGGNVGSDTSPDASAPDAGAPQPDGDAGVVAGDDALDDGTMTFFVTSNGNGNGGNLGGLAGADAFCTQLATAASPDFARRTWHAYLSTTTVDARDRIGAGPWRNQAGVIIANDLTQLHDQLAGGTLDQTWPVNGFDIPLDETGAQVPAGNLQNPQGVNQHDILTGSDLDGTLEVDATGAPLNCADWTATTGMVQIGHTNRAGLAGQDPSWNSVHPTGCAPPGTQGQNVTSGGGRGSIYCFAVITGQ